MNASRTDAEAVRPTRAAWLFFCARASGVAESRHDPPQRTRLDSARRRARSPRLCRVRADCRSGAMAFAERRYWPTHCRRNTASSSAATSSSAGRRHREDRRVNATARIGPPPASGAGQAGRTQALPRPASAPEAKARLTRGRDHATEIRRRPRPRDRRRPFRIPRRP
jgi:hypothetical protein